VVACFEQRGNEVAANEACAARDGDGLVRHRRQG
jgi:hypothetical protein